jgi:hypothetical protein
LAVSRTVGAGFASVEGGVRTAKSAFSAFETSQPDNPRLVRPFGPLVRPFDRFLGRVDALPIPHVASAFVAGPRFRPRTNPHANQSSHREAYSQPSVRPRSG